MKFDDVKTLERTFLSGKVSSFPDRLSIGEITYNFFADRTNNVRSMYNDKFKPTIVYSPDERTPTDHSLVFVWGLNKKGQIAPSGIITLPQSMAYSNSLHGTPNSPQIQPTQRVPTGKETSVNGVIDASGQHGTPSMNFDPSNPFGQQDEEQPLNQQTEKESDRVNKVKTDYDARTIGSTIEVTIIGFNQNMPIVGKVDTGATYCSLHAEELRIRPDPLSTENADLVSFIFNDRRYTVPVVDYQAIASADGGVNQRPVITFNVKIKDELHEDIMFNLNDRSNMEDPLLIGMNLLKKGKFLIDPKMESFDWQSLNNILIEFTPIEYEEPKTTNEEVVRLLLKLMEK